MNKSDLTAIAKFMLASPKGLLAADESNGSAKKRFDALGIECTPDTRRDYRAMLLTAPDLNKYISGVIFYDETIRQSDESGTPLTTLLTKNNIMTGIKVDKGLVDLTNFETEKVTEGLDGLAERLAEYYQMGARFTKWRAAFNISDSTPSDASIHINATMLGRYAALVQAAGMVPIIEPEVLLDGNHSISDCEETLDRVLKITFQILAAYRVYLPGLILKTSMVLSGKDSGKTDTPDEVADATLRVLVKNTPPETAGVVFLSGGQSPAQATANMAAIGASKVEKPWPLTYSFSRAVQDPDMKLWLGKKENVASAQDAFIKRVAANSAARVGQSETIS